jgi:RNA polymerase sigma-70 factor (ECF subfamily)
MSATLPPAIVARSDEDLVAAYLQGDPAGFDELNRRYRGSVYALCLRMTGRPQDAEDLTQDIFVQILRSLAVIRTDRPLRPWIFVVARHKCLDHLKRRRILSLTDVSAGETEATSGLPIADATPLPDEVAERADLKRSLDAAIGTLPERYRAVVTLRYSSDLTFAQIGGVLGQPENTVKTHFQRAKALLRVRLASLAG